MSRDISAVISAAVAAKTLDPFFAVSLAFDSSTLRLFTGHGSITFDGNIYTGAGTLLNITDIEETSEIQASGVTLVLTGVPTSLISMALDTPYQGRVCTIYFGVMLPSISASQVFSGYMDQMIINENSETCKIVLSVENRLIDLERPRIVRFSQNDQESRFTGDLGLEFVESLQTKEIYFGKATPK